MAARATLLPLARKRAELETASYSAGRASLADAIEAKTALADAELTVLDREATSPRLCPPHHYLRERRSMSDTTLPAPALSPR
jgi:hypothetical protein